MSFFVRLHLADIVPVQQPVQLLTRESDQFVCFLWPLELVFSQTFVIQDKAVIFPEQALDLVPSTVGESVQVALKRVMSQLLLNQDRQSVERIFENRPGHGKDTLWVAPPKVALQEASL